MIGLSGLITPSLDEMIYNAQAMTEQGWNVPLLIGGATTSLVHTAVKIAPHYQGSIVHVSDASLVIEACSKLMGEKSEAHKVEYKKKYQEIRESYLSSQREPLVSLQDSRSKKFQWKLQKQDIARPHEYGVFDLHPTFEEVKSLIDWSPFFWSWGLKGVYPSILDKKDSGEQAQSLFKEANQWLEKIYKSRAMNPKVVVGFFRAQSEDENINILDSIGKPIDRLVFLRQQREKEASSGTHYCLADFVAPQSSNIVDSVGMFAVTAGTEIEQMAEELKKQNDDYSSIMVKALADRVAEALAEWAHKKVRAGHGYGLKENLSADDLIQEKYRGIRPAPGYPACPDHRTKLQIWKWLDAEKRTGIQLTENLAMKPASSVSGLYFHHPEAKYFHVGPISEEQLQNYAKQSGVSLEMARRWLSSSLSR